MTICAAVLLASVQEQDREIDRAIQDLSRVMNRVMNIDWSEAALRAYVQQAAPADVRLATPFVYLSSYDDSLDGMTKNVRSTRLDDLLRHLRSVREQGGERLEVLGLKVRASAIRSCGLALILVTQAYMLLHLRTLQQRLGDTRAGERDTAFTVPWIALYADRMAKRFFSISCFWLPFLVCAWLVVDMVVRGPGGQRQLGTIGVAMAAGATCSGVLAALAAGTYRGVRAKLASA